MYHSQRVQHRSVSNLGTMKENGKGENHLCRREENKRNVSTNSYDDVVIPNIRIEIHRERPSKPSKKMRRRRLAFF